jgi:hypothetical protein
VIDRAFVAAVVKTELLLPVGGIGRGIHIQNNFSGRFHAGRAEFCETLQQTAVHGHPVPPGECIFPAAQGGLRTQGLSRRGVGQQLENGIVAQQSGVVGVFVAGHDLIEALREQRLRGMVLALRQARVGPRCRPAAGQVMTYVKLPQRQQSGVGTDLPAVEVGHDSAIPVEGKIQLCLNTLCHCRVLQKRVLGSQKTQC